MRLVFVEPAVCLASCSHNLVIHTAIVLTMPFPKDGFTYYGGCNCRAVRYRVSVPEYSSRPDNPYGQIEPTDKLPMVAICYCNNCRRAHGQFFGFAIINKLSWVDFSLSAKSTPAVSADAAGSIEANERDRDAADNKRTTSGQAPWVPASDLFDPISGPKYDDPAIEKTWLRFYSAKQGRSRGFCGRCGTHVCYFVFGSDEELPDWWFPQLDIWASTVDRCDLEEDGGQRFAIGRQLWADYGLTWAKKFGAGETAKVVWCGGPFLESRQD